MLKNVSAELRYKYVYDMCLDNCALIERLLACKYGPKTRSYMITYQNKFSFIPVTLISLTTLHAIHLDVTCSLCVINIKNGQQLLVSEFFRL